jgi:hypothetical protein
MSGRWRFRLNAGAAPGVIRPGKKQRTQRRKRHWMRHLKRV